jgi:hypothetical protein
MNPIDSVNEWVDGVGHNYHTELYASLVLEEAKEMLEAMECPGLATEIRRTIGCLDGLSYSIRKEPDELEANPIELLDAALDLAWVSLCLARTLVGDNLGAAWSELHRSNIIDKQVNGKFIKDTNGKVLKPAKWQAPDFDQFLL